jgi:hypothetical protein
MMRAAGLSARRGSQFLGAGPGPLLLAALSPIAASLPQRLPGTGARCRNSAGG